ncbi:DUF1800 domain-containing protein [Tumebacillus sp. ITR2]|uniref:DUF1800 domain-containing protein n=1 Tax=Tumebacillus amylolyticus TaxID=2801339 RepID=A0ABS1J804_9BACL|nr:DUF1800 domain-containing protein [Tumebacillus amylolyticus]MBL0386394.1 DUF1800 domain-containing protein [Tumebacillus amylolyticus]
MKIATKEAKIQHLLRRTGFTATKKQMAAFASLTIPQVVDKLLNAPLQAPKPPENLNEKSDVSVLVQWWLNTMIHTPNPLQEKMTLFWHGHFTSSFRKVRDIHLLAQQNVLLRKFALGNFRELTYNITVDAAMLIYLDNNTNMKKSPNENYARELMELFTLGLGNYTETDVKEVARALTGWQVKKAERKVVYVPNIHDDGKKTIFRKTDTFDTRKTTDWIVAQPACATYIATKLWKAFAYPNPEPSVIKFVTKAFIDSGYEIKALLKAIFNSEAFYSDLAYRAQVLSPVEYTVGMLSLFPTIKLVEDKTTHALLKEMGQVPFDPPNVSGWQSGPAWLNSAPLFGRFNFVDFLVDKLTDKDFPINTSLAPTTLLNDVLDRLGLSDLSQQTRAELESYLKKSGLSNKETIQHGLLHLLLISPEAQVH